ncbi:thermonuclease family protein [Coleofasciculus sp. FACHB-T130]|uniref:thermonuclease family protein n=2 Tax=Cyanobacteriota TaxID=1117 RepID=UPI001F555AE3|nr:thermonuclease family protein [Coleofasciculus sp. FACHB-T130]
MKFTNSSSVAILARAKSVSVYRWMKNNQRRSRKTKRQKNFLFCLLAFGFWFFLVGCQAKEVPTGVTVKVERVVTGQTLEVLDTSKQSALVERVRLLGIEAPDMKQQPWGSAAQERLKQLIGGQSVLLESDGSSKDQFERRLAYVWKDGVLLNEQMVVEGYVFVPRSLNNKYDQRLTTAQEYARIMGKGIWNPEKPMRWTPAEFRRQNR